MQARKTDKDRDGRNVRKESLAHAKKLFLQVSVVVIVN
jgi:hypothetical protein